MLWIRRSGSCTRTQVPYEGDMPMWLYLRDVLAPALGLECVDGTVRARVHTPELRTVFNNECRGVPLGRLIPDYGDLVLSPWPSDGITIRSLEGNARPPSRGE